VRIELLASPERVARIQRLELTAVHDPSPALAELAGRFLAIAAAPVPAWLADMVAGPDVDVPTVERSLRAAAARFGPMRLGLPTAGDGLTTATFDVEGEDGKAGLTVTIDPDGGVVTALALMAAEQEAAAEAW
jgi:hypothetical protein